MPFLLMRNDITKVQADAIVNTANMELQQGSGTSRAIFLAAGEKELQRACRRIGHCDLGKAVITDGFRLPAKYIIHAVGPIWQGGRYGEDAILYSAYMESLKLAREWKLTSIAFPLISAGNYGYPKERALKIAVSAISDFLMENDMLVYLVLYDKKSLVVSQKLFASIEEYIDEHYIAENNEEYPARDNRAGAKGIRRRSFTDLIRAERDAKPEPSPIMSPEPKPEPSSFSSPETESEPLPIMTPEPRPESLATMWLEPSPGMLPDMAPEPPRTMASQPFSAPPSMSSKEKTRLLDDIMLHIGETFSQMLLRLIDERGMTDSEVYHKANIDRKLFSKIRTNPNYSPAKKTIMAFAVALELSLDETKDLLGTAGYTLSGSSRFDVILSFFLENKIYDIFEINEMLFYYDQPMLGV